MALACGTYAAYVAGCRCADCKHRAAIIKRGQRACKKTGLVPTVEERDWASYPVAPRTVLWDTFTAEEIRAAR